MNFLILIFILFFNLIDCLTTLYGIIFLNFKEVNPFFMFFGGNLGLFLIFKTLVLYYFSKKIFILGQKNEINFKLLIIFIIYLFVVINNILLILVNYE